MNASEADKAFGALKKNTELVSQDEGLFSNDEVDFKKADAAKALASNFEFISSCMYGGFSACEAQLDEAAEILFSDAREYGGISENERLLSSYKHLTEIMFSKVSEEEAAELKIKLCSAICKAHKRKGFPLTQKLFFAEPEWSKKENVIAYLKNPYSELAYNVFSSVISDAKVSYGRDFNAVCEEVYYGSAKYCILPMESSVDGSLSGFRKLAAKYELCPVLSCFVSSEDGERTTRFVLFAKNIVLLELPNSTVGEGCFFTFRLNAPEHSTLLNTLKCLRACGMRTVRIESDAVEWDEGRYSFEITASCDGGELAALLCYLSLEVPEYTPVGIYSKVKSKI